MGLHIAIDASRTTTARVTGTEHYAIELLRALITLNEQRGHQLTLYFRDAPSPKLFPSSPYVRYRVIPMRRLWTHLRFAAALWQDRPDVTFVPAHTLPVVFPGRGVVTVHDLGFKIFPEAHPPRERAYLDWTTRFSAQRAQMVLADSAATAHDLTRFYGTPQEKIRVVYPGVSMEPASSTKDLQAKYGLPSRYFLFIGTLQPRKNIARIAQAFARFREQSGNDTGLVLAGGRGWLYDPSWTAGIEGIYLPGYIDQADKSALYAGAVATVFPSLYEGFGFPALESMLCGTPVIASHTSSLPELVGDAGLLVDPLNVAEIADAMARFAHDAALRLDLQQKGYTQARKFTWENAALQTMSALEAVCAL
jgi:glycosyltransferase involved in cell wall biosynthesis